MAGRPRLHDRRLHTRRAPHLLGRPLTGRVALLLGTEHEGLPAHWRDTDHSVSIPMNAARGADSLNVATAAALVLFECARQRRAAVNA
ncbi:TrmH family RNA methyltransferase [Deinococcus aquaticus]|uniref:TrmH family RNA methyltransferase n=1 Tax=Deinococcus aquaticus TaxID=328692 RepID=UPI00362432D3